MNMECDSVNLWEGSKGKMDCYKTFRVYVFLIYCTLLVNPTCDGKYQLTIQNSGEGSLPTIALETINKPKKISSINTWLQASHMFVEVYWSKDPHGAWGLWSMGALFNILQPGTIFDEK